MQKNPTEIGEAFLFNVKIEGMMVIPREVHMPRDGREKLFDGNERARVSASSMSCKTRSCAVTGSRITIQPSG
ncbi:MAG: hypothetical protein NUW00_03385, partial [Candidatus Kaiserbacteria bacterium]|nr:hypothetical protein [Candidatus Kaiserbacteria bacterium]